MAPSQKTRRRKPDRPPHSPSAPETPAGPLPAWAEAASQEVLRHAVTATCWLDAAGRACDAPVTVRFSGRRAAVGKGRAKPGDRFEQVETIDAVVPGSGPVSVTTKVPGLTPGEWHVWARSETFEHKPAAPVPAPPPSRRIGLRRFLWTKGNPVPAGNTGTRVNTRPAGFATGPGLVPASWLPLVALGVVVALVLQVVLAGRAHLSVGATLAVSIAASLAGAVGARVWFVALNRGEARGFPTRGLCIQGFIAAAAVVLLAGVPLAGLPLGRFLDISTPGLFFAMAIGRQGCFLYGCCVGRPTSSRWGVWASDGKLGARRAPTQQLESLACLVIGLATLLAVLYARPGAAGTVFVGALAAYTAVRQLLFPYRAEPRRTSFGRRACLLVAGLILVADIIIAIVA